MAEMTFDEWVEQFKPIKNRLGDVRMFETYGEDYEFVKVQNPLCIWTYGDAGEGSYIVEGWHYVNRIGYYITEIPFNKDETYFIELEEEIEDEEE